MLYEKYIASKNQVFLRTFTILSIITFIPLTCISLLFSNLSERFFRSEGYTSTQQALIQYVNDVDNRLLSMQEECLHLSTDTAVISFILNPTFSEISRNTQIMKSLNDICVTNNGVEEAYLYSNFTNLILASNGKGYRYNTFFDQPALDLYNSGLYQSIVQRDGKMASKSLGDCIAFYQNIPENSTDDLGCLIFNMKKDFLFSLRSQQPGFQTAVYEKNQNYLFLNEHAPEFLQDEIFLEKLSQSSAPFTYEDYIVLSSISSTTGWTFIGLIPMPLFLGQYRRLSQTLMVFALFALLFSLLMSFVAARRIHQPLKNLVSLMKEENENAENPSNEYKYIENAYSSILKKNRSISSIVDEMRPSVKNSFFFGLLLNESFSEEEMQNKLQFIGENFTQNGYGLILFSLDNYESFTQSNSEAQQTMYNYQLTELISEKIGSAYPYALIRINLAVWALILNVPASDHTMLLQLEQHFSTSVDSFPCRIYVAASSLYDSLPDISYALREAQEVLNFRRYQTPDSSSGQQHAEGPDHENSISRYRLNAKLEESLLQAIRSGSVSSTEQYYSGILNNMHTYQATLTDVSETASYIMNLTIETLINMGISTRDKPELCSFYEQVKGCSSPSDVQSVLRSALVCAASSVNEYNSAHPDKNIERLLEYIHTHLNEDISLTNLADICQMSPSYVSRLFKKQLNIGFVEYLNRLRIQRAEQLLKETTMTVEQIGYQVGFTNIRNFMRVFKQYENMSPGQYRIENSQC